MSKRPQRKRASAPDSPAAPASSGVSHRVWVAAFIIGVLLASLTGWWLVHAARRAPAPAVALTTNEVAHSLMVTVELDFGGKPTGIRDALKEIERRSEPADGRDRTFAILDAYGETTPAGKLHVSMHLSLEKPGFGALIFRRTGEVLWKSKIVASTNGPTTTKQLTIYMADTAGKSFLLDGSKGAARVLDVPIEKSPARVRDLWPDGAEHEFTFLYSVCGCPVKAKVRRTGETTARTTELPVMFPDDPAALALISRLMGWRVED